MLEDRGISGEQLHDDLATRLCPDGRTGLQRALYFPYPDEDCDKRPEAGSRIRNGLTGFPIGVLLGLLGIFLAYRQPGPIIPPPCCHGCCYFGAGGPAGPALSLAGVPAVLTDVLLHGVYRVMA